MGSKTKNVQRLSHHGRHGTPRSSAEQPAQPVKPVGVETRPAPPPAPGPAPGPAPEPSSAPPALQRPPHPLLRGAPASPLFFAPHGCLLLQPTPGYALPPFASWLRIARLLVYPAVELLRVPSNPASLRRRSGSYSNGKPEVPLLRPEAEVPVEKFSRGRERSVLVVLGSTWAAV